jgi:hypothetical protein
MDVSISNFKNFQKDIIDIDSQNKKINLTVDIRENYFKTFEFIINGKRNNDTVVDKDGNISDDTFVSTTNILIDNIKLDFKILSNMVVYVPEYSPQQLEYLIKNNIDTKQLVNHNFNFYYNGKITINLENFYLEYNRFVHSGLEHVDKRKQHLLGLYDKKDIIELNTLLNDLSKK